MLDKSIGFFFYLVDQKAPAHATMVDSMDGSDSNRKGSSFDGGQTKTKVLL